MAPKTRAKAAAGSGHPWAKRSRASPAAAPPAETPEEANNSTHNAGGANQGSYEALQQELADLRREMAILRGTPTATLVVLPRVPPEGGRPVDFSTALGAAATPGAVATHGVVAALGTGLVASGRP